MAASTSEPNSGEGQPNPLSSDDQFLAYKLLFALAFDELHAAVTERVNEKGIYIGARSDYPTMSLTESRFPIFHEVGHFDKASPRDYVSLVRPPGLMRFLAPSDRTIPLPRGIDLAAFLRDHAIGSRLKLSVPGYKNSLSDWPVEKLVADAVERYIHMFGLNAPIDAKRRDAIIQPLVLGSIQPNLYLSLVVPILTTHFDVDRFRLNETSYIAKLPRKLQLGRARINPIGSGAPKLVAGAATHAFISNGWHLSVDDVSEVPGVLSKVSVNALDAIDTFFGSLRLVTGINTGYAQILWVPRTWTLEYYADLTPVYGTTIRRYPNEFDDWGWVNQSALVTSNELKEVQRVYRTAANNQSEAIRLAMNRLNSCLTRSDAADAILDGTIGLELLLGDDDNQSLSYKLRLRAAALAMLQGDPAYPAATVAANIKKLYSARSKIVHGRRKKRSNKASEPADTSNAEERALASGLLRFVLNVLLMHPEYLEPSKIDEGLLLRADQAVYKTEVAKRRRPKSKN
jgi:hypothetical protein